MVGSETQNWKKHSELFCQSVFSNNSNNSGVMESLEPWKRILKSPDTDFITMLPLTSRQVALRVGNRVSRSILYVPRNKTHDFYLKRDIFHQHICHWLVFAGSYIAIVSPSSPEVIPLIALECSSKTWSAHLSHKGKERSNPVLSALSYGQTRSVPNGNDKRFTSNHALHNIGDYDMPKNNGSESDNGEL